jgi:DNA-binding transcriptional LysR family regulator
MVDEGYDLALRLVSDGRLPAGVIARCVRAVPFRLGASRAYLERYGVPKVPQDLGRHDIVAAGGLDSLWIEGPQGTLEVPLRVAVRCHTMAGVAITVAGGVGLGLLPAAMFNDPAFVNVLRPTLTEFRLKEPTLHLLYPDRKHLPFKARAFIDLVLESGAKHRDERPTGFAANRIRSLPLGRLQAVAS